MTEPLQFSGMFGYGSTSVTVSTTAGGPERWTSPTAGNTLIAVITSGADVSSFSGWTQDYAGGLFTQNVEFWSKESAGNETSITATMDASEDHSITVFEMPGTWTYDTASHANAASNSVSTGSTGTLEGPNSIAVAGALAWDWGAGITFDSGYTLAVNYNTDTPYDPEFYYMGSAYKELEGTTATSVTASWDNFANSVGGVAVYTAPATGNPLGVFMQLIAG